MVMTAVAIFSVVDVLSKYLTRSYPVALVVWARYAFHLLLVVVVLGPRYGLALVRTIAEFHHISLQAQSDTEGTTITLSWPQPA